MRDSESDFSPEQATDKALMLGELDQVVEKLSGSQLIKQTAVKFG